MDEPAATVKEVRQVLRRVQDHLNHAHLGLGVQQQTVGFVDVVHHPDLRLADLNYVTPRRNTAWVSGQFVQKGLERLKQFERRPRVRYIEGLFPPQFGKTLNDLGLELERKTPFMVYYPAGMKDVVPPAPPKPRAPKGVRLEMITDARGSDLWRDVWSSTCYDVSVLGFEPLAVQPDTVALKLGEQIDVLIYHQNLPVGAVRLGLQPVTKSAHVIALAVMSEINTPRLVKLALAAALRVALKRGCDLVFAADDGDPEQHRLLTEELGFVDVSTMLCYAARSENADEVQAYDLLAQPVLALRR